MNKPPIIILHGWGLKGSVCSEISFLLEKNGYQVFSPDLPGFGSEPLVKNSMNLDDYVDYLRKYMQKNKIKNTILIGHSFGGRVALKFAWKNPNLVKKIILTGVPIIRHMSARKKVGYLVAVFGGKIFAFMPSNLRNLIRKPLYFVIGEWDYYKAGPLTQVFKNIVEEDLIRYVIDIKLPILLVWGKDDKMTPSEDVETIKNYNKKINSIIIQSAGHKLPYDAPEEFFDAIIAFLQDL